MNVKRSLVAAACALTALVGSVVGLGTSTAAAKAAAQPKVFTVLAGNARYLIYRVSTSPSGRMSVYERTRHGQPRRVISGTSRNIRNLTVSLVGSTLTADEGAFYVGPGVDTRDVHWWTLNNNDSGILTIDPSQVWQGTVPGGFLLEDLGSDLQTTGYSVETLNGTETPFDNQFSDTSAPLEPGPSGLVSGGSSPQFEAYGSDKVRTLQDPAGSSDSDEIGCSGPSARYLRCFNDYDGDGGKEPYTYIFVPLDGSTVIDINGTVSLDATPVGAKIAYRRHGVVVFQSPNGIHRKSRSSGIPVGAAFGGLITVNHAMTKVSLVSNAKAQPLTLLSSKSQSTSARGQQRAD
jgi:hypothetical protein